MRGSLRGALSRVERLARCVQPSAKDWARRLSKMGDQEFYECFVAMLKEQHVPEALFEGLDEMHPFWALNALGDRLKTWEGYAMLCERVGALV